MSRYAESTAVPADKSRMEIEATLRRYGADAFAYGWDGPRAVISFRAHGRYIRFVLTLPDPKASEFTHHSRGPRTADAARAAWEKATRQKWRALALVIKAKLEAVSAGIGIFEDEFLAHVVLPDGATVGDWIRPQVAIAYERGEMPPLLPDYSRGRSRG